MEAATQKRADDADQKPERGPRSETPSPQASLTKAIEFVKTVRKVGGNGDAPTADVMKEMGINVKTTRSWSFTVPAAMQFGLVERIGRGDDAKLRVTDLAKRIVQSVSPEELHAAKMAALRSPQLYEQLLEKYADCEVPARDGLINLLCRDFKILDSTAPNTADCFLESLAEAGVIKDNRIAPNGKPPAAGQTPPPPNPPLVSGVSEATKNEELTTIQVPASFVPHHFTLRKNMVVIIPLPPDLKTKEVERLSKWLATLPLDESDAP
jgi:hypothetical protein